MAKLALVAVSLAALLGTTQVYAQATQSSQCQGELAKAEPLVNALKDDPAKQDLVKQMGEAKNMMAKNDEKGCMAQMQKVQDQMLDLQRRGQQSD